MNWFERQRSLFSTVVVVSRDERSKLREGRSCMPLSFDFLLDHIPSNGELTFRISAMQVQYRKCTAREKAWSKATNISF